MEAGSVVRAIFDFCPSVSEELPLFVGDIIEVLAVVDEFWLLGKKEDVTGQFPSSFVEIVTIPSLKEGERLFVCICEFTSRELNSLSLHRGDLVILDGTPAAGWLQGRSCWGARGFFPSSCVRELCLSSQSRHWHSQPLQAPEYAMGQARALMGLSAQLDEELDFREGDVITIIGVPEPGWFEGELEGRRGIFPEGFVELLGPLRTVGEPADPGSGDDCVVNGEADVSPGVESGADEDDHPTGTYGIALYRFEALEPNELDFDIGDKIRILGTLEDGWLEGRLKGRTGIFPHRFVKVCPSARTEETAALPQEGSPRKNSEGSVDGLGSPEVEEARHEPQGCEAERPDYGLSEQTPVLDYVGPDCVVDKNSGQDGDDPGSSPGVDLERPLAKDPSVADASERVNGVSSQPQEPFYPKVQKNQYYLTTGGSHRHSDLFSELLPLEARPRDYSSLPPKRTCAQGRSLQKPAPHLHRASSLTASRIARPSHFCHPIIASYAQKHQTSAENASSLYTAPGRPERRPGLPDKGPATETTTGPQGDIIDLDSKLTQQLIEFEKSLSGPNTEPDKIVRRFSILDFNSEKDIVRGSSKSAPSQDLPERRKALRPPPPRPCTPTPIYPHLVVDQSPKPKPAPPLAVRPSRPAPLPPSAQQRMSAASPKPPASSCAHPGWETPEEGSEHEEKSPAPLCPSVLLRIQDVEHDLDMYTRAQGELNAMLEEKQDELLRAEMLENLRFYESTIQSLNLELQQLRGKWP